MPGEGKEATSEIPQLDGRADRLALLRLYDGLDDAAKQELLRTAVRLSRKPEVPA